MGRLNPFFCTTERSRRVSISLSILALLSWVTWVGVMSNGFSEVHHDGWYVLFGAPVAAYAAVLAISQVHRKGSREVRFLFSLNIMWAFLIGAWGYIWNWEYHFSFEQYLGLLILPLVGLWLAFILWSWSKSVPVGNTADRKEISENEHKKDVQAGIAKERSTSSQSDREKWRKPVYWAVGILIVVLGISQSSSTELLISFIFTWTVILIPPVIVRFVFVGKPIVSMNIAAAISGGLYFFNLMLFIALGSQSKTHAVLVLGAIACYNILKYETKKQADARLLEERKRLGYD
ncbi:MAG: hypothetical protein IT510_14365 [Sulfuritalea sp.]|nr:hypothetical protein [Sulfuritalea sp.]